jgi:hypothetical protein
VFDMLGALYFEGILVIKYLSVVVFNMLGAMDFERKKGHVLIFIQSPLLPEPDPSGFVPPVSSIHCILRLETK